MQKHFFKYSTLILILTGLSLGFNSCVKEYTCKCDISFEGKPGLPAPTSREYRIQNTNNEAKRMCQNASSTVTEMGITTIEECDLY